MELICKYHNEVLTLFNKKEWVYFCDKCENKSGEIIKSKEFLENMKRLRNNLEIYIQRDRLVINQVDNLLKQKSLTNVDLQQFEQQFDMQDLNKKQNNLIINTNRISLNDYQLSLENILSKNIQQESQILDQQTLIKNLQQQVKEYELIQNKYKNSNDMQIQSLNQKNQIINTQITIYQQKVDELNKKIQNQETNHQNELLIKKQQKEELTQQINNLKQQLSTTADMHYQQNKQKNQNLDVISNQTNELQKQIEQLNLVINQLKQENKQLLEKITKKKIKSQYKKSQINDQNQKITKFQNQINNLNQNMLNFTSKIDTQNKELQNRQLKINQLQNQKYDIQNQLKYYQNSCDVSKQDQNVSIQSILDQLSNTIENSDKFKQQLDISQKVSEIQEKMKCKFQGSQLLSVQNFELIQKWSKNQIQNIKLIYKGNADGFNANNFHNLCDKNGKTLCIIQSEYNSIFGGYADIEWNQENSFMIGQGKSFLFQLDKKTMHKCIDSESELFGNSQNLIQFGKGPDLIIKNNGNIESQNQSRLGVSYELPKDIKLDSVEAKKYLGGEIQFKIKEIEVYQTK